jgi:hypothetical protein
MIYKIISKVIALRLEPILPFIISKEQSGYVYGRKIMDSVILVHEIIHSLKITHTLGILGCPQLVIKKIKESIKKISLAWTQP